MMTVLPLKVDINATTVCKLMKGQGEQSGIKLEECGKKTCVDITALPCWVHNCGEAKFW